MANSFSLLWNKCIVQCAKKIYHTRWLRSAVIRFKFWMATGANSIWCRLNVLPIYSKQSPRLIQDRWAEWKSTYDCNITQFGQNQIPVSTFKSHSCLLNVSILEFYCEAKFLLPGRQHPLFPNQLDRISDIYIIITIMMIIITIMMIIITNMIIIISIMMTPLLAIRPAPPAHHLVCIQHHCHNLSKVRPSHKNQLQQKQNCHKITTNCHKLPLKCHK